MRDSVRSHVHLTAPRTAVFFEEWMKLKLEYDDIIVPPENQPINPDDDDDLIPDQQASFGVLKSQQQRAAAQATWKDLRLKELLHRGPEGGDETILPRFEAGKRGTGTSLENEEILVRGDDEDGDQQDNNQQDEPAQKPFSNTTEQETQQPTPSIPRASFRGGPTR